MAGWDTKNQWEGEPAKPSGGGKSRAQKKAEKYAASPKAPQDQLVRLAARLNSKKPGVFEQTQDALGEALQGYSEGEIRKIGRRAELRDSDIDGLVRGYATDQKQNPIGRSIGTGLDYISRPGQAVVSGLAGAGDAGKPVFDFDRALRGLKGEDRTTPIQAGIEGVGGKSTKEAQKIEGDLPGPVRFVGNTAGSIATDPLTYVTFGTGAGAEAAVRSAAPAIAERRGLRVADDLAALGSNPAVQGVAEDLAKRGLKALSRDERKFVRKDLGRGVERGIRRAPGGVRVAGHAVPGTVKAQDLFKSLGRRGAQRGVDKPGAFTNLERLVSPRAGARQLARSGEAPAGFATDIENLTARYTGRARSGAEAGVRRAAHATKGLGDDALLRVQQAMEDPAKLAALTGKERKAADALDAMRSDIDRIRVNESGMLRSPEQLEAQGIDALPLEQRYPRVLSPEARDLYGRGKLPQMAGRPDEGGLSPRMIGRDEATKYAPTESIRLPAREGEVGAPRFELHPGKAMAQDFADASRDTARVQFVDELSKVTDDTGVPFVKLAPDEADLASGAWVEKQLPVRNATEDGMTRTQPVIVRKEISDDFDRLTHVLTNDAAKKEWLGHLNDFNNLWKAYATSVFPFGSGFVIRNAEGNLINGFLLGNTNPRYLFTASRLQHKMLKGIKESGDALAGLGASERGLVQEALDTGVLESGFFTNLDDLGKQATFGSKAHGAARAANPLSQDFAPLRVGKSLNEAVENNARLGMYLGQRAKGLSSAEAARMVRKYLFDYSDLTGFDRGMKYAAPFWTWTRKNTPLQLSTLLRTPGKIAGQKHVLDALSNEAVPHESEDVPLWMLEENGVVLPVKAGGDPLAWVPDLPVTSAQDALDPLTKLVGVAKGEPGGVEDLLKSAFGSVGFGGATGVGLAGAQVAAGKDIFSGRPFYPGERVATPIYLKPLQRLGLIGDTIPRELQYLGESALPAANKLRGALPTDPADKGKQTRRLLSMLTGQTIWPIDDAARRSESFRRVNELDQLRRSLEAQGVKIPDTRRRKKESAGGW